MEPTPNQPPQHQADVRPTGDTEEIYYHGTPRLRGEMAMLLGWGIPGALLVAAAAWWFFRPWENQPRWWGLIALAVGLMLMWIPIIVNKFVRYRISNYRIDYEKGLLGKKIETLELWHVDDIEFEQSFFDRVMGVGKIIVFSNDKTTPKLELKGLPNPRPLFESLKQRVIAVKRQRGVIKMDIG